MRFSDFNGTRGTRGSWAFVAAMVLLMQFALPIVSDEAYFISWGKTLSPGFYDHPPLTGWLSFGLWRVESLLGIVHHGILFRLFSLALGGASLGLLGWRIGRMKDPALPASAVILLALIPGYLLLFNLYLNDTIEVFLSLVFVLACEAAFRASRHIWLWLLVAGLAFAAMLLTKYTGAVVYLGMLAGLLFWRAGRRFLLTRLFLISLVALGPFLWHLWWSFNNCSVNLAFNFAFRNARATGYGPLWLALTLVVMAGPAGVVAVLGGLRKPAGAPRTGFFGHVFWGSLAVMLAISLLRREFGVNWGGALGFLAVLALAERGDSRVLKRLRLPTLWLSALVLLGPVLLIGALKFGVLAPARLLNPAAAYSLRLSLDMADGSLQRALRPLAKGRVLVATEYGIRAGFQNAGFDDTTVFSQSVFGRNQDLFTDFRALQGRDMLLIGTSARPESDTAAQVFKSFTIRHVQTARGVYQVVLGQGFAYESYRKLFLKPVLAKFYDRSPFPARACFMDKYR